MAVGCMIALHNNRPFVTIFCYLCASNHHRWVYLLDLCNACSDLISLSTLLMNRIDLTLNSFSILCRSWLVRN